jgi:hypothetical protein
MKFGWKQYWKPTPLLIRKIADAVFATTTCIGSAATFDDESKMGMTIIVIGFIAKTVSNFFSEENQ